MHKQLRSVKKTKKREKTTFLPINLVKLLSSRKGVKEFYLKIKYVQHYASRKLSDIVMAIKNLQILDNWERFLL